MVLVPPADSAQNPGTPWSAVIALKNDPLVPVQITTFNDDGTNTTQLQMANQCYSAGAPSIDNYSSTVLNTALANFQKAAEQYRTTSLSLTGTFIGATLTDQGSVIAAQMSDPHMTGQILPTFGSTSDSAYTDAMVVAADAYILAQDIPTSDSLVLGTAPYVAAAKEGFYMPYKMEDPDHWHRTDNLHTCIRMPDGWFMSNGQLDRGLAKTLDGSAGYQNAAFRPYPNNQSVITYQGHDVPMTWLPPLDEGLGVVWIKSVARTTTFRLTLRCSIEVMTRPASALASFCDLPALPDDHAVAMYREIASRMKDCYPSRDNATGSLWDKIKSVAAGIWDTVSPALASAVPMAAPVVTGVNMLRRVVPGAIATLAKKGGKSRLTDASGNLKKKYTSEAKDAATAFNAAQSQLEAALSRMKLQAGKSGKRRRNRTGGRGGRGGTRQGNGGGKKKKSEVVVVDPDFAD